MKPELSIIIVNFNTIELLNACLGSLFLHYGHELRTQKYKIIVVDNHSWDESVVFIKKQYPSIFLLVNQENLGFSKANNLGIQRAYGKYVLLLNPDTQVLKGTLPVLTSYMDKNPTVGVATCKVVLPNGELDDACHRGFPTPWRAITYFSGISDIFPKSTFLNGYHLGYQNMDKPHEIEACVGACMMIRSSVGQTLQWMDTDYFWYGEDLDFCYRVKQLGYSILFIPEVAIVHHKGAASGLKKHSRHLSKIDRETSKKIKKARFDVMRIFYKKHYQHKYPRWVMQLVMSGIWSKQKLSEII